MRTETLESKYLDKIQKLSPSWNKPYPDKVGTQSTKHTHASNSHNSEIKINSI